MPQHDMAWYAVPGDQTHAYERVGHFIKGLAPLDAREITAEEAAKIDADVTARTRVAPADPAPAAQATPAPDNSQAMADLKAQLETAQAKIAELEPKVVRADRLLSGIVADAAKITGAVP